MATDFDFLDRCEAIEECYEFMLAYAGQGLPSDEGSSSGSQIREFLQRAIQALNGIAQACTMAVIDLQLEPVGRYQSFISVIYRDAQDSAAAIDMVMAQPSISSQLIDNLNASMHLRALLTDLFLLGEIVRARAATAPTTVGVAE